MSVLEVACRDRHEGSWIMISNTLVDIVSTISNNVFRGFPQYSQSNSDTTVSSTSVQIFTFNTRPHFHSIRLEIISVVLHVTLNAM
jgi:hypothetical protein